MIRNGLLETDQIYFVLALPYFLLCGVRISVQDFEAVINRTQSINRNLELTNGCRESWLVQEDSIVPRRPYIEVTKRS